MVVAFGGRFVISVGLTRGSINSIRNIRMRPTEALSKSTQAPTAASGAAHVEKNKPSGSPRYAFVDLLRGWALVIMIETHVINAYLPAGARRSGVFFWLSFLNGLVAPSFLFASGFSVVLQARRQWADWLRLGPAFRKHIKRLGFIILVAYYLHLPYFGLSRFLVPQDRAFWQRALQIDVLQCIVVSLLLIDALIFLLRSQTLFVWASAICAAATMLATPWMWDQDFTKSLPLSLAMFLNPHGVSLFPIFPWMSFVLAGSCAAHLFLNAAARQQDARYMRWALFAGILIILAALGARSVPVLSAWNGDFYRTSPLYVLIRLGCVLIFCVAFYVTEKRLGWVPAPIRLAGQESLLVYGAHLLIIFSVLRQPPLATILGREAGYGACLALSGALILLMLWSAQVWHGWKREQPRIGRYALLSGVGATLAAFILR